MQDYIHSLGKCVREARKEMGLTQLQVADKINIDTRTVMNIENFKGNPKLEVLFPLVRALQIDPWDIFYPERKEGSAAMRQLQILLMESSDEEIESILPICRSVLEVLKARKTTAIE